MQFNFIARANNWVESKVIALVTSLRGKARAILNGRKITKNTIFQYNILNSKRDYDYILGRGI